MNVAMKKKILPTVQFKNDFFLSNRILYVHLEVNVLGSHDLAYFCHLCLKFVHSRPLDISFKPEVFAHLFIRRGGLKFAE